MLLPYTHIKAIDDTTLEVTLKGPTPYFLEMLTHQAMYPVSKANVEKFGDDFVKVGNLVSNGAFTATIPAYTFFTFAGGPDTISL